MELLDELPDGVPAAQRPSERRIELHVRIVERLKNGEVSGAKGPREPLGERAICRIDARIAWNCSHQFRGRISHFRDRHSPIHQEQVRQIEGCKTEDLFGDFAVLNAEYGVFLSLFMELDL